MRFWITSWFTTIMLLVGAASTWGAPHTNTIPFTETAGDDNIPHILIQATINGKPVQLIFDTGADMTAASSKVLKGCRVIGRARQIGAAGEDTVTDFSTDVVIGTDTLHDVLVETINPDALSQGMHSHVDGLLGETVISQYKRVTIDFEAKTITLEN